MLSGDVSKGLCGSRHVCRENRNDSKAVNQSERHPSQCCPHRPKPLNYTRPFLFPLVTQPFSAENATFCVLECVQHPMASVIPNATSWVPSAIIHPAANDSSGRSPFLVLSAVYLSCISSVRCFVYVIPQYIFRTIANRPVQTISECVSP